MMLLLLPIAHCIIFCSSNVHSQSYSFENDYMEVYPNPMNSSILQGRTPLFFGLIQSLGGPYSLYDSSGTLAGVKIALDMINNDTSMLPGYTLHYTFSDSKCNISETMKAFFTQILKPPTKLALIGAGCSPSTEATALISHFYNITQISCASSSTELQNRVKFPYYFQMLSTDIINAYGFYALFQEFGWRRVEMIVQDENIFKITVNKLKTLLNTIEDFQIKELLLLNQDSVSSLGKDIFDKEYRIILLATYVDMARELLCLAYQNDVKFPKYVLLTFGWYQENWWKVKDSSLNCSGDERGSVLLQSLAILTGNFLHYREDLNLTTNTGITGGEFLEEEKEFINKSPLNISYSQYSQYCYDGVWTLAYALNKTINELPLNFSLNEELAEAYKAPEFFTLSDFSYEDDILLKLIFQYISNTSFIGISGPVKFGKEGIRVQSFLTVLQYQSIINKNDNKDKALNLVKIGEVTYNTIGNISFSYVESVNNKTLWNGLKPFDGIPLTRIVIVDKSVTIIFIILAIIGMFFSVSCLIFNLTFTKSKLVKLASPKLNYLIIAGSVFLYGTMIVAVIDKPNDVTYTSALCNVTTWLSSIGYSLCFGTMIMKMVRVFYIFRNPLNKKKILKDWILGLAVFTMVMVDFSLLLSLTIVTEVASYNGKKEVNAHPSSEKYLDIHGPQDIVTENIIYVCDSIYYYVFSAILFGYKGILQILSLILALSIRKVKVKGVNNAKYVAAAAYVVSLILAVLVLANYLLVFYINVKAIVFCTGYFVGATTVLGLVFLPLMVGLYKDPKGEKVFESSSRTFASVDYQNATGFLGQQDDNDALKKRITELECQLESVHNKNAMLKTEVHQ